jgi:hypothetical protein
MHSHHRPFTPEQHSPQHDTASALCRAWLTRGKCCSRVFLPIATSSTVPSRASCPAVSGCRKATQALLSTKTRKGLGGPLKAQMLDDVDSQVPPAFEPRSRCCIQLLLAMRQYRMIEDGDISIGENITGRLIAHHSRRNRTEICRCLRNRDCKCAFTVHAFNCDMCALR